MPADQRAVWRAMFDHFIFTDPETSMAHLTPEQRGLLGPPSRGTRAPERAHTRDSLRADLITFNKPGFTGSCETIPRDGYPTDEGQVHDADHVELIVDHRRRHRLSHCCQVVAAAVMNHSRLRPEAAARHRSCPNPAQRAGTQDGARREVTASGEFSGGRGHRARLYHERRPDSPRAIKHFSSITAENAMKPDTLWPNVPGSTTQPAASPNFTQADMLVNFAANNDMQASRPHVVVAPDRAQPGCFAGDTGNAG